VLGIAPRDRLSPKRSPSFGFHFVLQAADALLGLIESQALVEPYLLILTSRDGTSRNGVALLFLFDFRVSDGDACASLYISIPTSNSMV
jgi:hypothetical protein